MLLETWMSNWLWEATDEETAAQMSLPEGGHPVLG
jgi:hypothetical protein